jgi:hypothetical protein
MTILTGETPLITGLQALASTLGADEIVRTGARLASGRAVSKHVLTNLAARGLDEDMLRQIAKLSDQYGEKVRGITFANSHLWEGAEGHAAHQAFESAVLREAHSVTMRPGVGDTPNFMATEIGKTLFQFKSFAFSAQNAVVMPMVQGVSRGDPRAIQALFGAAAMGYLSYVAHRKAAGKEIETDHPGHLIGEVVDKGNLAGWMGQVIFPLANQMGYTNVSRYYDQNAGDVLLGPSAGEIGDIWKRQWPGRILESMTGESADENRRPMAIRRSDVHGARKMLPLQNWWMMRREFDHMENAIGDYFNLPGKPLNTQNEQIQQD